MNNFSASDYNNIVGTWDLLKDNESLDLIGYKIINHNHDENNGPSNSIPETFDARYNWFECVSISHIWNQGNCAADWVGILHFGF